jgi:hypothetical protein
MRHWGHVCASFCDFEGSNLADNCITRGRLFVNCASKGV